MRKTPHILFKEGPQSTAELSIAHECDHNFVWFSSQS